MIKPGVIPKGRRAINPMETNTVVGSHHTNNNNQPAITKITKMVNTTTTNLFINPTNIRINNIVDTLDPMVGKIKNIAKIL